jgi:hypothetical protein
MAHDEFFWGENREQERQEWSCRGGGQADDVIESKYRINLASERMGHG